MPFYAIQIISRNIHVYKLHFMLIYKLSSTLCKCKVVWKESAKIESSRKVNKSFRKRLPIDWLSHFLVVTLASLFDKQFCWSFAVFILIQINLCFVFTFLFVQIDLIEAHLIKLRFSRNWNELIWIKINWKCSTKRVVTFKLLIVLKLFFKKIFTTNQNLCWNWKSRLSCFNQLIVTDDKLVRD